MYDTTLESLTYIGLECSDKDVQQALFDLREKEIKRALAENPFLDRELWQKLSVKGSADLWEGLARTATGDKEVEAAIAAGLKYKRSNIFFELFSSGLLEVSCQMAREIVESSWFNPTFASFWLDRESLVIPECMVRDVAKNVDHRFKIRACRYKGALSAKECVKEIKKITFRYPLPVLASVLDTRPELVPYLVKSRQGFVLEALVFNRHIFDQEVLRGLVTQAVASDMGWTRRCYNLKMLAMNPNSEVSVLEKILRIQNMGSDVLELKELVRQVLQERLKLGAVKIDWSLVTGAQKNLVDAFIKDHLSYYPSLRGREMAEYKKNFRYRDPYKILLRSVGGMVHTQDLEKQVMPFIGKFGVPGWFLFFTLMRDWEGSLGDLRDSCVSLLS